MKQWRVYPTCQFMMFVGLALTSTFAHSNIKPNILLLVAEDLSPRIGSYGDAVAKTPNLNALARSSIRFTQAFTTAGVCAPSRAALMMGMHQISFAAQHMRTSTGPLGKYYAQPKPGQLAFPELLRRDGYYTFTDRKLDYQFSGIVAGSGPFSIWDLENASDFGWRNRSDEQPFFGLINFIETHESGVMRASGDTHSESHKRTQMMRTQLGVVAPKVTNPKDVILPPYYPDVPAVRADLARHYDNIHNMDKRLGIILNALIEDGLFDNTIIIWTTDHGDGLPRAKRELFDTGIHVPLLMSLPTDHRNPLTPIPSDDTRLVSFVDLGPTILQMAGLDPPQYMHGKPIFQSNRSFVYASRDRIDEVHDRQRAIRSKNFKYIRSYVADVPGGHKLNYRDNLDMVRAWRTLSQQGSLEPVQSRWFEPVPTHQLYNLNKDPWETNNLAQDPAYAGVLLELQQALHQHLESVGDTGAEPEAKMRQRLLNNNRVPSTPKPVWQVANGMLMLNHSTLGSIGYKLDDGPWQLYTAPLPAAQLKPHTNIHFKAVNYGQLQSAVEVLDLATLF